MVWIFAIRGKVFPRVDANSNALHTKDYKWIDSQPYKKHKLHQVTVWQTWTMYKDTFMRSENICVGTFVCRTRNATYPWVVSIRVKIFATPNIHLLCCMGVFFNTIYKMSREVDSWVVKTLTFKPRGEPVWYLCGAANFLPVIPPVVNSHLTS